jgi:hypothetical protein
VNFVSTQLPAHIDPDLPASYAPVEMRATLRRMRGRYFHRPNINVVQIFTNIKFSDCNLHFGYGARVPHSV